jgi:hypothetical protein
MARVREDANVAQARVLVGALREQLQELRSRLARAEAEGVGETSRARAMRLAARDLHRDAGRAQFLIERLHRRFPGIADGVASASSETSTSAHPRVEGVGSLWDDRRQGTVGDVRRAAAD